MANHDRCYKNLFFHKPLMAGLLDLIPEGWVQGIDRASLRLAPTAHVSEQLSERLADVVWLAKWGEEKMPVYLLMEFRSTVERLMALRLHVNSGLLEQSLVQAGQQTPSGKLPQVFPMVLYNGLGRWTPPMDASQLYESVPKGLNRYQSSQTYYLMDLQRFDARELEGLKNAAAVLIRLESSRSPEEIERAVSDLMGWFPGEEHQAMRRAFAAWLREVLLPARFPEMEFPQFEKLMEVKTMLAERVRQWPRQWEEKGIRKGVRKGIREGVQRGEVQFLTRLLELKFGPLSAPLRAKIAKADSGTRLDWANRIPLAETIDQVFEDRP